MRDQPAPAQASRSAGLPMASWRLGALQYRAGKDNNGFVVPQRGYQLILIEMQRCDRTVLNAGIPCMLRRIGSALAVTRPPRRAPIGARVRSCEVGGFRFTSDRKPIFVR